MLKLIVVGALLSVLAFFFYQEKGNGVVPITNYDEYVAWVVEKKDPTLCEQINFDEQRSDYIERKENLQYFCYADFAIQADDLEYCLTLDNTHHAVAGSISQRHRCVEQIAVQRHDPQICQLLTFSDNSVYSANEMSELYLSRCLALVE